MNTDLNERQINLEKTCQRLRLIPDLSEVAAQTPKNSFQQTVDFNKFFDNRNLYRF